MANKDCNGDFFTVNGTRFYRCLWDGSVAHIEENQKICMTCDREIDGTETGEVSKTYIKHMAVLSTGVNVTRILQSRKTD